LKTNGLAHTTTGTFDACWAVSKSVIYPTLIEINSKIMEMTDIIHKIVKI